MEMQLDHEAMRVQHGPGDCMPAELQCIFPDHRPTSPEEAYARNLGSSEHRPKPRSGRSTTVGHPSDQIQEACIRHMRYLYSPYGGNLPRRLVEDIAWRLYHVKAS